MVKQKGLSGDKMHGNIATRIQTKPGLQTHFSCKKLNSKPKALDMLGFPSFL